MSIRNLVAEKPIVRFTDDELDSEIVRLDAKILTMTQSVVPDPSLDTPTMAQGLDHLVKLSSLCRSEKRDRLLADILEAVQ